MAKSTKKKDSLNVKKIETKAIKKSARKLLKSKQEKPLELEVDIKASPIDLSLSKEVQVPDMQNLLGGNLIFAQPSEEEETFHQRELIQLFPYGVSLSQDMQRPFVLLKDETLDVTMPVAIHPIEAGSVINLGSKNTSPYNPHQFLTQILESLDIEIKQCVFVQLKGSKQFVRIYFQGHNKLNSI
ncbi:MAG: bifunctional nuclease family protein, partial [Bdellovibrionales bacterium]|nr:bifunctional nuclease family protein [Bdellovibrionales bacterium]